MNGCKLSPQRLMGSFGWTSVTYDWLKILFLTEIVPVSYTFPLTIGTPFTHLVQCGYSLTAVNAAYFKYELIIHQEVFLAFLQS